MSVDQGASLAVMHARERYEDSYSLPTAMILPNSLFVTQREEGMIQGQLNNSDSSQYIRELKDQIDELKAEVRPDKRERERQNP